MASSFHNQPATSSPPIEPIMSSPLPISEYNSSSMNLRPAYPFIPNPWIPLDPMFPWPYPSTTQYNDPRLWAWAAGNHPLFGQGPAFPNYAETPSWMMNLGQPAISSPPVDVLPSSTSVVVRPETVIHDTTAAGEQASHDDRRPNPRR
jgi:hypothetical protein